MTSLKLTRCGQKSACRVANPAQRSNESRAHGYSSVDRLDPFLRLTCDIGDAMAFMATTGVAYAASGFLAGPHERHDQQVYRDFLTGACYGALVGAAHFTAKLLGRTKSAQFLNLTHRAVTHILTGTVTGAALGQSVGSYFELDVARATMAGARCTFVPTAFRVFFWYGEAAATIFELPRPSTDATTPVDGQDRARCPTGGV